MGVLTEEEGPVEREGERQRRRWGTERADFLEKLRSWEERHWS